MIIRKIWDDSIPAFQRERLLLHLQETETISIGYVALQPGESTQLGLHDNEEEGYVVLSGKALLMLGDSFIELEKGHVVYIPRNTPHRMTCISDTPLEYLYFANFPDINNPAN